MRRVSPRHIALFVLLAASLAFLLHALRGRQAAPPPAEARATEANLRTGDGRPAAAEELAPAAPAEADFGRYAALARTDVFSDRRTPAAPKQTTPVPPPPPLPNGEDEKPRAPKIDFSGWTYAGYIALDGKELGILQNDTTHTCKFLAVGDEFLGATVEALDRESMKVKAGSSRTTLSRPRDFSISPLDKAATAPRSQPQPRT